MAGAHLYHPMNCSKKLHCCRITRLLGFVVFFSFVSLKEATFAALDIVSISPEGEEPLYVLKNIDTGTVLGTFWNRAEESSDYGFESSIVPDFLWSEHRDYVAVSGGASRSRAVSLYRVTDESLEPIEVPQLTEEQAAPLLEIDDVSAEGTDAVRWQADGTLLLRFWATGKVTSDTEDPKEINLWATLEIADTAATLASLSQEQPSGPDANDDGGDPGSGEGDGFNPNLLVGVHHVIGRNPDGSEYTGTVEIRVVKGVVGLEWKIGNTVSHGNGVLVGNTLGVALDVGLSIYRLVGQSEGQSLIGRWSAAESDAVGKDTILIGNAEMTDADFPAEEINGTYLSLREVEDGQVEGRVTISGEGVVRDVVWKDGDTSFECKALALSDGLAVLTPDGLSVYQLHLDNDGVSSLVGTALSDEGKKYSASLSPIE